jgi:hypothetical protein
MGSLYTRETARPTSMVFGCCLYAVYVATQTPGSPGAAADIAQASYEIACATHFVDEPTRALIDAVV